MNVVPILQGLKDEKDAAQFIVDMCSRFPGEIHILALGPLTNIALACQLDPKLGQKLVCNVSTAVWVHECCMHRQIEHVPRGFDIAFMYIF